MNTAVVVFAKAPVPGQAKTRLIPALGPAGAAALAQRLLAHAVEQALAAGLGSVDLCVTPDTRHTAFQSLAQRHAGRLTLSEQGDGDLGDRMHRALTRSLKTHAKVLLIGTDAPGLTSAVLQAAAAALDSAQAVWVPALDGGYALVGLIRPVPELFGGMVWSTPQVMAQTRQRARQAGLRWTELPALADIDEPADLAHLPLDWQPILKES